MAGANEMPATRFDERIGLIWPVETLEGTFLVEHALPRPWLCDSGRARLSALLYRD